jgi:hypothetical protein
MKSFQINLTTIIVGVVLLSVIYFGFNYYTNQIDSIKTELSTQVKLKNALLDTITYTRNERNELVAEKLTLQGTIKQVTDDKNKLTDKQKELFARIKEQDKKIEVISAALVDTKTELTNLKNSLGTFSKDTLSFPLETPDLSYLIKVTNVKPAVKTQKSELIFSKFIMLNTQEPKFFWNKEKRADYPVSFSISNSNKYITTTNIESYVIPGVDKIIIKPTGWQKFVKWTEKTTGKVGILGVGIGIGYLLFKVIAP